MSVSFISKKITKKKKSLEPFGICLQNSTANLAHFHSNWTWLAVLFSRQIQGGSHSLKFLSHIILGSAGVKYVSRKNAAILNSKTKNAASKRLSPHCGAGVSYIVRNSIWLKKNRASDNEGKFHSFLMCRIWIYSQKLFYNWTSDLGCIWHIFGKLGYFWLFLSALIQAASGCCQCWGAWKEPKIA